MADPQPEETQPAAGVPEPTRVDDGSEPSTVDAPVKWSGSATVPPPSPKKPWWRRDAPPEGDEPTPPDPWAATPPVDPWADQDTPWETFPIGEAPPPPMPPTRIEPPAPVRVAPPAPAPPAQARPIPVPPARPQPPKPSKPSKPSRKERRERKRLKNAATPNRLPVQTRPALPAPPPWAPRPTQRPLPPPRRKRRWGRRLALLSLLGVVCCCGLPLAALQLPSASQYPVTAVLPQSLGDLQLRDTQDTGPNGFAGVYRDDRGKRVTVIGETGFRLTPGADVGARLEQASADYNLKNVESIDLGESGAHGRCGVGRDKGASVVVCAWADHGSLATVLLTRRSVADSAELVARLRDEVLTRG